MARCCLEILMALRIILWYRYLLTLKNGIQNLYIYGCLETDTYIIIHTQHSRLFHTRYIQTLNTSIKSTTSLWLIKHNYEQLQG